jgi:hypothetical protein
LLEELIDQSSGEDPGWMDKVITSILTNHSGRLAKIQSHVNDLGLRVLIRNNCRAKNRAQKIDGSDLFGEYRVAKRVAVPYHDENGKLRFKHKPRGDLTHEELADSISRLSERPNKPSKALQDLMKLAERTQPYKGRTTNLTEALNMAQADGK